MKALIIAGRELRSLFFSPLAWSVLGVVEAILAWMFLAHLDYFLQHQAELATLEGAPGSTEFIAGQLFGDAAIVLMLVMPLLTMRVMSEELRSQTLTLLLSSPISMTAIVLGKYLGILGFVGVLVGLAVTMPLSLLTGGNLDFGLLVTGGMGLVLLTASFAAAGLFISTLTAVPTLAAVGSFGLLLLLWVVDWTSAEQAGGVLAYLSLVRHYDNLMRGVFDSADVAYYLLFILTFLVLAIRRLDAYRLQH
ncbi:ABC transporter permease [Gammaproteobacteria bacterium]